MSVEGKGGEAPFQVMEGKGGEAASQVIQGRGLSQEKDRRRATKLLSPRHGQRKQASARVESKAWPASLQADANLAPWEAEPMFLVIIWSRQHAHLPLPCLLPLTCV